MERREQGVSAQTRNPAREPCCRVAALLLRLAKHKPRPETSQSPKRILKILKIGVRTFQDCTCRRRRKKLIAWRVQSAPGPRRNFEKHLLEDHIAALYIMQPVLRVLPMLLLPTGVAEADMWHVADSVVRCTKEACSALNDRDESSRKTERLGIFLTNQWTPETQCCDEALVMGWMEACRKFLLNGT